MAKYSRFDSRNKKRGKHKSQSIEKDIKIKEVVESGQKQLLNEVMYDDEYDYEQEPTQLRG